MNTTRRTSFLRIVTRARLIWIALFCLSFAYTVILIVFHISIQSSDPLHGLSLPLTGGAVLALFLNQVLVVLASPPLKESEKIHDTPPDKWSIPKPKHSTLSASNTSFEEYRSITSALQRFYDQLFFQFYTMEKSIFWGQGLFDDDPWPQAWGIMSLAFSINVLTISFALAWFHGPQIIGNSFIFAVILIPLVFNYFAVARESRRYIILSYYVHQELALTKSWVKFKLYMILTLTLFFAVIILMTFFHTSSPT